MAITYAMGDGFDKILPINNVENRGILSINGVAGKSNWRRNISLL